MAFETLSLGLTLTLPTNGTRNWGTTLKNTTWTRISQHQHTGSGDGNQIPTGGIVDRAVTSAKLALNIGGVQASTLTPSGTTQAINFALGTIQKLDLGSASGDVTTTFANPVAGARYKILVVQGATPRLVTWPTVKWANGQAPILSTPNGSIDILDLYYDGSAYYGQWDVAYA